MKDSQRWINIYLVYIKLFAWKTGNEITAQYCRVQEHLWFRGRQDRVDVVVEIMSTTIIQSHKEKRKMAETKLLISRQNGNFLHSWGGGRDHRRWRMSWRSILRCRKSWGHFLIGENWFQLSTAILLSFEPICKKGWRRSIFMDKYKQSALGRGFIGVGRDWCGTSPEKTVTVESILQQKSYGGKSETSRNSPGTAS